VRQSADLIKKVNEDLSLDKPLHVIYKVSKLAYRISVILTANERVKKKKLAFDERGVPFGDEQPTERVGTSRHCEE
jgi:hypothetical protein